MKLLLLAILLAIAISQSVSGDLRGVARGDGKLGFLCGKAGTSHMCDGCTPILYTYIATCYAMAIS